VKTFVSFCLSFYAFVVKNLCVASPPLACGVYAWAVAGRFLLFQQFIAVNKSLLKALDLAAARIQVVVTVVVKLQVPLPAFAQTTPPP
jgi:hypothetical protein